MGVGSAMDNYYYYHQPKYFNPVTDAILEMARISAAKGTKLAVVIFPDSSTVTKDFRSNYPYLKLHTLVKSIPGDNIVFIDLLDEFNRLNLSPQDVSINYAYNESHKNPRALGVSAQYIYENLREERLIP
jgi:hypothetical protein